MGWALNVSIWGRRTKSHGAIPVFVNFFTGVGHIVEKNPVTKASRHIGEKFSTVQEMGVLVPSPTRGGD